MAGNDKNNDDWFGENPLERSFFGEPEQKSPDSGDSGSRPAEKPISERRSDSQRKALQIASMEGDFYELVEETYQWQYTRPQFTPRVRRIGGYERDVKPGDFDRTYERRSAQQPRHETPFICRCSLSDRFADRTVFRTKNILLEILQNAEPRDSKGTWFGFEFYARGKWRSVVDEIHKFENSQIEALRIVDNGKGYLPTDMTTIGGGKREDKDSAGNFGTGMKASDQSALEKIGPDGGPIRITRYSRNWKSEPFLYEERTSWDMDTKIAHRVWFFDEYMPGSVVEYRNIPDEVLDEARRIGEYYIPLDETLEDRVLTHNEYGLILSPKGDTSMVSVMGRHYEFTISISVPFLFSYDLHRCGITDQSRHTVDTSSAVENVRQIWRYVDDVGVFLKLFETAGPDCTKKHYEHKMDGIHPQSNTFLEAARKFYGLESFEKVYLSAETSEKNKKILRRKGFRSLDIGDSGFLKETFQCVEVFTGDRLVKNITDTSEINTDLSGYKRETFASCASRAVEAAERLNGGHEVQLVVIIENNGERTEIPYSEFLKSEEDEDGRVTGFSVRLPAKVEADIPQKLETLFAACIAAGVECYVLNGKDEFEATGSGMRNKMLVYRRNWSRFPEENFSINMPVENSTTAGSLKRLDQHSLRFDPNYEPLERTEYGDVVSLKSGKIYEQGVLKQEVSRNAHAIFSYNMPYKVTSSNLPDAVSYIISRAKNKKVITAILQFAKEHPSYLDDPYPEYFFASEHPEVWAEAFVEVFGENAVVDDVHEDNRARKEIMDIKEKSKLEVPRLHPALAENLRNCGVKRLSYAVQAATIMEHKPTPFESAILKIEEVIDATIARNLPERAVSIPTKLSVVDEIKNRYGQAIRSRSAYVNPFAEGGSLEMYLYADMVDPKNMDPLIRAIFERKIAIYKAQMEMEEYASFRFRTLESLANLMSLEFFRELQALKKRDHQKAVELIERKVKEVDVPAPSKRSHIQVKKVRRLKDAEKARRTRGMVGKITAATALLAALVLGGVYLSKNLGVIDQIRRDIKIALTSESTESPEKRTTTPDSGKKKSRPQRKPTKMELELKKKEKELQEAETAMELELKKKEKELQEAEAALAKLKKRGRLAKTTGFRRPRGGGDWNVSVNINRGNVVFGDENEANSEDKDEPNENHLTFLTTPPIKNGNRMREALGNSYNGRGWNEIPNAPKFEGQNHSDNQVAVHWQRLSPGQKRVVIRTRMGGKIDPKSIELQKDDLSITHEFLAAEVNNGEYEITIQSDSDDIAAVRYRTLVPQRWRYVAEQLTDEDFARLNRTAYEFHTQTPDLNLEAIRVKSKAFPDYDNLKEFLDALTPLPPYQRVMKIRDLIHGMRYAKTKNAEQAYRRFQRGEAPEKDLVEFLMNSEELAQQGDGDCDAHNTLFAILCRYAGVPSRITVVSVKHPMDHAPAEVFFPKIGWVGLDTMGSEVVREERHQVVETPVRPPKTQRTPTEQEREEAEIRRMYEEMQRQLELERRGCLRFIER